MGPMIATLSGGLMAILCRGRAILSQAGSLGAFPRLNVRSKQVFQILICAALAWLRAATA